MSDPSNPVLATKVEQEEALLSLPDAPKSYTYYHAGPLFSLGDLQTNVRLSSAIRRLSDGRYEPILPQDLEQRDTTPHSIRDEDIRALLKCDLALFTYDGLELDSGTVVEYMISKFADMPTVILRSDFRGGGDQAAHGGDPWNLMSSFWPRTARVVVDGMVEYKIGLSQAQSSHSNQRSESVAVVNQHAGDRMVEVTARRVVEAFDHVLATPARLPKELKEGVYQWLALMPGFKRGDDKENTTEMLSLLKSKVEKGLL